MKVGLPPSPYGDVLTLHDVTPWTYPDEVTPPPAAAAELRRADAVVTVSQYSAGEIERRFGVQAHVIPNGIDARLLDAPPMSRAQMASLGLHGRYVVVAGGASARKNLDGLAQAWTRLGKRRNGVTLALAGPEHPSRTALFAAMPGALLLGRVPDDLLPRLLAGAEAVIVPSLCEGFGLPALEGMAVGVPVVAANTSALPEVVGDAGLLVDPTPESLAEGIEFAISGDSALVDLASRGRARASQFTWERSVRMHAELWCRIEKGLR